MQILCGNCGPQRVRFEDFQTMLVLSEQVALLSYTCPTCGIRIGVASGIPYNLRSQAQRALKATGADDGRATWPSALVGLFCVLGAYPPGSGYPDAGRAIGPVVDGRVDARHPFDVDLSLIDKFRDELDHISDVDDAIDKMNGFASHE